jgi:uncharacterized protein (TIRG00374 family)
MSSKWRLLLMAQNIYATEWKCFRIYAISNFVGLFLPATVGADFSRAAIAKYDGLQLSGVASSIVIERLLGFAALIFLTIIGLIILAGFYSTHEFDVFELLVVALGLLSAFLAIIYLSFSSYAKQSIEAFELFLAKRGNFGKRCSVTLHNLYLAYAIYQNKKAVLISFFLLSCLEGMLMIVLAYIVTLSLGIQVNFIYLASCVSVVMFLIRLPISIDGFGIYEKGIQYFLLQVGVAAPLGLAAGILYHAVCLAGILPGGLLMAFYRKPR